MAIVHCNNSIGIVLRLYDMVEGPFGIKTAQRKGDGVELRPGRNEIDDAFWSSWSDQNKENQLLGSRVLVDEKAEEKKAAETKKKAKQATP